MNEEEIREHAERLILTYNEEYEFGLIYEDDELKNASTKDWKKILDAMHAADVRVVWP